MSPVDVDLDCLFCSLELVRELFWTFIDFIINILCNLCGVFLRVEGKKKEKKKKQFTKISKSKKEKEKGNSYMK